MTYEWLLFPVIAWYDIISLLLLEVGNVLLFPVIAWYDIICTCNRYSGEQLLFPVIAWYDIILTGVVLDAPGCCSRLSLGMI